MDRWVWLLLLLMAAIVGIYVINPYNTATSDPRARILGVTPYRIPSSAMAPTLIPGDMILTRTSVYMSEAPQRGDIVVFRSPRDRSIDFVFRVAALSGERIAIRNSVVYVNDQPLAEPYLVTSTFTLPQSISMNEFVVPEGHFFVLGDNRDNSFDSRFWGAVPINDVIGKVTYIWSSTISERVGAVH
jgi:signal peptidase I